MPHPPVVEAAAHKVPALDALPLALDQTGHDQSSSDKVATHLVPGGDLLEIVALLAAGDRWSRGSGMDTDSKADMASPASSAIGSGWMGEAQAGQGNGAII